MTVPHLHYDILITIFPFLGPSSLIQFATVCQSYSQPALRRLWHHPRITQSNKLHNFIRAVLHSIQQQQQQQHDRQQYVPRPYYEWITGLTIAFPSFQPIPLLPTFQSILFYHLPNLVYLSLHHTHAIFAPSVQRYQVQYCILEVPISAMPRPITIDNHQSASSNNDSTIPWLDLYFNIAPPQASLPLTYIAITHSSITGLLLNDDYLHRITRSCPNLRHIRLSGFFTDKGVQYLADRCHSLEIIFLSLPKCLAQSNTITHASLDRLAMTCPRLTRFSCLGQTRLDSTLAEQTFRLHCPHFSYCDFGTNV